MVAVWSLVACAAGALVLPRRLALAGLPLVALAGVLAALTGWPLPPPVGWLLGPYVAVASAVAFRELLRDAGRPPGDASSLWRFLFAPAVLVLVVLAIMGVGRPESMAGPGGGFPPVHLLCLAAACATGAAAAGAALAMGLQDRALKLKRPGLGGGYLPPLARSDAVSYRLVGVTLGLLTAAILVGVVAARQAWHGWRWNARTLGGLVLWLHFAVTLHVRRIMGWRGARLAWFVVAGWLVLSVLLAVGLRGVTP